MLGHWPAVITVCLVGFGATAPADDLPQPPKSADDTPAVVEESTQATPVLIDDDTVAEMAQRQLRASSLSARTPSQTLWTSLIDRTVELIRIRHQLGTLNAEVAQLKAELAELRSFVKDHDTYGDDFASYARVVQETKRQTQIQARMEQERRRLEQQASQQAQKRADRASDAAAATARAAAKRLRDMGFTPVGQDVWLSKSAYAYAIKDVPNETVHYRPGFNGSLQRTVTTETEQAIDYSKMTISGSLLNAAAVTRNIGVAFVFRDAHGNQVGQETVVIENARPGVPYPFTGELTMASQDRPFASTTNWVLFADEIVTAAPPPANPPPANPPAAP